MEEFSASLVREKIVLTDDTVAAQSPDSEAGVTVIRSNRIFLKLATPDGTEKVVVRGQNMHATLRMCGRILLAFYKQGLILNREKPFDWEASWHSCLSVYEKEYNASVWCAVYINGKPVYKTTTSPFVDVIEQCALLSIDDYDRTMNVAENVLKKVGKNMTIKHSSNVAAVFSDSGGSMRCGVMLRADGRDTTFNFVVNGGSTHNRVSQSVRIAGAFLEGVNLRFLVKKLSGKVRHGEIEKFSAEGRQMRAARSRLMAIIRVISAFEGSYEVKYRPEKPELFINA